jgi:hypothetical protein
MDITHYGEPARPAAEWNTYTLNDTAPPGKTRVCIMAVKNSYNELLKDEQLERIVSILLKCL